MKKLLLISCFAALLAAGCQKEDATKNGAYEMHYTSSDDNIVELVAEAPFGEGVNIVSNTYQNGLGTIKTDEPFKTIANNAFSSRTTLTGVSIPAGVTVIGQNAFSGCQELAEVSISHTVTTIGQSAFSNDRSLETIDIPANVHTIENLAFYNCSSLKSIYIHSASPLYLAKGNQLVYGQFRGLAEDAKIYVPHASVEKYKADIRWRDWIDMIEGF